MQKQLHDSASYVFWKIQPGSLRVLRISILISRSYDGNQLEMMFKGRMYVWWRISYRGWRYGINIVDRAGGYRTLCQISKFMDTPAMCTGSQSINDSFNAARSLLFSAPLGESHHPMHIRSFEFCHCYCHRNTCHELHPNHRISELFWKITILLYILRHFPDPELAYQWTDPPNSLMGTETLGKNCTGYTLGGKDY